MNHVIIDTLNFFLRISDVLIDLFIRELKRSDAIEKKKTSDGFPRDKYKHNWHVMKNLSIKVWESLLILKSTKRAKSWNIEILLDQKS